MAIKQYEEERSLTTDHENNICFSAKAMHQMRSAEYNSQEKKPFDFASCPPNEGLSFHSAFKHSFKALLIPDKGAQEYGSYANAAKGV